MAVKAKPTPTAGIHANAAYTLAEFKSLTGLKTDAVSSARRKGLKLRRIGTRSYVAGSDWLDFLNFTNTAEISTSTGGATNFENVSGSGGSETIKGDANANILTGAGGSDILYGYAGDDILAGGKRGTTTLSQIENWDSDTYSWNNADNTGNNTLFGGAGDD